MNPKYRNIFLGVGVVAIIVMLFTFDMSWDELWRHVLQAGYWFPAVIALWLPIYMINAWAWYVIINDGENPKVSYWRILKYTISGFALNYVTPVGLLGGEPYRIMELKPYVGAQKATSSVILYAMMHIFSHFWFWAFSIVVFIVCYFSTMNVALWILMAACSAFCILGIYFFLIGYRKGLAMKALNFFVHWPIIGKRIRAFRDSHEQSIQNVDQQIAMLHRQRRSTFYLSLLLEFVARIVGCLELLFILFILTDDISFWDCLLMQAFTSLFANLMFVIPMQMGTREGGFALVTNGLKMSGSYGVLTGLITRLRELVWIAIGLALIRIGNKKVTSEEKKN